MSTLQVDVITYVHVYIYIDILCTQICLVFVIEALESRSGVDSQASQIESQLPPTHGRSVKYLQAYS